MIENDRWFAYVCQLDEGDDWQDPEVWIKANPLLGVAITRKYLEGQVQEAKEIPSQQNIVKRLNFCIWTEQSVRWLDVEQWKSLEEVFTLEDMAGRECIAGLDLSSVRDLTPLVLLFPPVEEGEKVKYWSRFWIPKDNIERRVRKDKAPYDVWERAKHIHTTPGNVIDYDFITANIVEIGGGVVIKEIAVDRLFQGIQMCTDLQNEGFAVVPFGQGWYSMAAPTREFEKMVVGGELAHDGNPVMTWNISNMVVKQDPAGNMKPDKEKATEKIDGGVAAIMATGRWIAQEEPQKSAYEEGGWFL